MSLCLHRLVPLVIAAGPTLLAAVAIAEEAPSADSFGEPMTVAETTSIEKLLEKPEKWEGKAVRVEGKVDDVCPKKGCWMSLTDGESTVRIKVEDGVIVFPKEAKGLMAVAEGIVRVRELDRASWVSWQSHLAEERGETFDAAVVGEGPFRMVQIEGRGAEIRGL